MKITSTKVASDGTRYNVSVPQNIPAYTQVYSNVDNKLDKEKYTAPGAKYAFASIDMKADESKRRDLLIKEAFTLNKRPIPEDTIRVKYKITPKGKILEMDFFISATSKLSADDIELIEETLKDKYTVKMSAEKFKGMKFTIYTAPINLGRIKNL
ncbi:hypothetical protein [Dyadobacter sp. OTU695]|uniref:hypothetical protein n=1 Tax=Dyadobacter sp. OTU695 TaxID=3043860 RepID=UPI00313E5DC9